MHTLPRRSFFHVSVALAAALSVRGLSGAVPRRRTLRLRWPWGVHIPDPHASNDLVAALLGATLFPPLYVRAVDGVLEPKIAIGPPKEVKAGLRIDLVPHVRPSDVVTSLSRARTGGARLVLRDVPVPRLDGDHSVIFPSLADPDALMRRLATPLAAIARIEPRRVAPTGNFELALNDSGAIPSLRLTRRQSATALQSTPSVAPQTISSRVDAFELQLSAEVDRSLRVFERGDTDMAWLTDGVSASRPGSRLTDLGPLAYLAMRAGGEVQELSRPGTVLRLVDSLGADRLGHLGLLRRGHCAVGDPQVPPYAVDAQVLRHALGVPIVVRSRMAIAVAAAEILAREFKGTAHPVDDPTYDRLISSGRFGLALEAVRPIDDSSDGAALALATFSGAPTWPHSGNSAKGVRGFAATGNAVFGWEIALLGAQASHVWVSRAPFGGLDVDGAGI